MFRYLKQPMHIKKGGLYFSNIIQLKMTESNSPCPSKYLKKKKKKYEMAYIIWEIFHLLAQTYMGHEVYFFATINALKHCRVTK